MQAHTPGSVAPAAARRRAEIGFIGLLTALTALGQFGSNVFLPGLPALARDLQVPASQAAWSFSLYLLVFGLAQLIAGPLADRVGRRPVAVLGALAFVAGGVVCATAPSLPILLLGRALQGLGAACTIVAARATARDRFEGPELARVMATMTIAFALVPGLAPLLGGVLAQWLGWRSSLWATVAVGLAVCVWAWRNLPQPLGRGTAAAQRGSVVAVYADILRDRHFMHMASTGALALGAMSAFFGSSPRLFLDVLGVGAAEYGLYPPLAVTGFVIGGIAVRRWGERADTGLLLRAAVGLQMLASAVLVLPAMAGALSVWQLNAGMVVFVTGLGVLMPVSMAAALSARRSSAGQSAAVLGFLQMSVGAAGTAAANAAVDRWPTVGMQATMALFVLANAALLAWSWRAGSRPRHALP